MRLRLFAGSLLMVSCVSLCAQGGANPSSSTPQQKVYTTADGGTNGRMESIVVPPVKDAPFTLTLATEWSRPLGNGGSFTLTNQRHIVRDGKGRIYQERWILVPKGGRIPSEMDVVQITDPALHTWYNCIVREKICDLYPYGGSTDAVYRPMIGATGPLPDGKGFRDHEELGVSNTLGVDTTGYRDTMTINAGVMGNDQPMVNSREFWYSARLGINLISKVSTPQNGTQDFRVTEITTSEPDPRFFVLPEGYKVIDHRNEGKQ